MLSVTDKSRLEDDDRGCYTYRLVEATLFGAARGFEGVGGKCMPKGLGSSDLLTQQKPRNI
jgi:hypothetical protein